MVGVFDESGPKSLRHGLDGTVNEWPIRPIRPIQPLCSDALRSLDVFCEKEITQTFVGYQGCTKDLLRIYQG